MMSTNGSGRDPLAATNGAESTSPRAHSAAVTLTRMELASLPELFRARRHRIREITVALHRAGQLADDPKLRDIYFDVALDHSQALDALEETLAERTRQ